MRHARRRARRRLFDGGEAGGDELRQADGVGARLLTHCAIGAAPGRRRSERGEDEGRQRNREQQSGADGTQPFSSPDEGAEASCRWTRVGKVELLTASSL